MNTVVSNNQRKIRASRPDGISLPSKGNHFSTNTARGGARDTKPSFPQLHPKTGDILPYKVDPYVEIDGIFFDDIRHLGIVPGERKATRTAAPKTGARKARSRRQDPGAGTRPSLSTMRRKG